MNTIIILANGKDLTFLKKKSHLPLNKEKGAEGGIFTFPSALNPRGPYRPRTDYKALAGSPHTFPA